MITCLKRSCIFLLFVYCCSFSPYDDCGEYRWDYKILIDPPNWQLIDKPTKNKTIHSIVRLERPLQLGRQRTPFETWKVTVTAWVVMLGNEGDRDYHLVLTNNNRTDSLIAEIPDPTCQKLQHFPALRECYSKARTFVEEKIGNPGSHVTELSQPIKVKLTGILFFDKIAHGKGHARNGIEIHPVISIKLAD